MTQQYIKLNTAANEIQQVNPGGPYKSQNISDTYHLINSKHFKSESS